MNRLSSFPAHKIIIWTCFTPSLTYILLYEFLSTRIPNTVKTSFAVELILLRISYSILAASIFYLISQYIGVYVPKEQKKIKILPMVLRYTVTIDNIINGLKLNLGLQWADVRDFGELEKQLEKIDPNHPVGNFKNWYEYLAFIKLQLSDLIGSITVYHDNLSTDFFHELLIIDQRLTSQETFIGHKVFGISNLRYASLDLQELFIHNQHLQILRQKEFDKYKKRFEEDGKTYRAKYYDDI